MGCCCKKKKSLEIEEKFFIKEENPIVPTVKELNIIDFQRLKLLGKSSIGQVYLVKSKRDNKLYSMKILDKNFIRESNLEEDPFQIEKDLITKINCPFVEDKKFIFQDKDSLYIIKEFIPGGNLSFHLHKERRFPNEKAKFYLIEMILAIEYLHKNNMIYLNLKPRNVLIARNGHIKLTDYSLSKILKKEKSYTICDTPQYLPPEILSDNGNEPTVDWWTLGCVFYEMLIGREPYKILSKDSLNEDLYKKRIFIPDYVTDEAEDLLNQLLEVNPQNRLGFGEDGVDKIKNHPYFKDVKWDDVKNKKINPPFIPILDNENDLKYFDSGDSTISGITINNNGFKGLDNSNKSDGKELMIMNKS